MFCVILAMPWICHRVQKNPDRPRWESNLGRRIYRQTLYHVAVKAGFYRKAVEVCHIPIPTTYFPALNWFVPESARNHAVIPGHFHQSDARNPSRGPPHWPPNVTGCRKIQTARGGNRTWAAGSIGKHSTTSLVKPASTARQ